MLAALSGVAQRSHLFFIPPSTHLLPPLSFSLSLALSPLFINPALFLLSLHTHTHTHTHSETTLNSHSLSVSHTETHLMRSLSLSFSIALYFSLALSLLSIYCISPLIIPTPPVPLVLAPSTCMGLPPPQLPPRAKEGSAAALQHAVSINLPDTQAVTSTLPSPVISIISMETIFTGCGGPGSPEGKSDAVSHAC